MRYRSNDFSREEANKFATTNLSSISQWKKHRYEQLLYS